MILIEPNQGADVPEVSYKANGGETLACCRIHRLSALPASFSYRSGGVWERTIAFVRDHLTPAA